MQAVITCWVRVFYGIYTITVCRVFVITYSPCAGEASDVIGPAPFTYSECITSVECIIIGRIIAAEARAQTHTHTQHIYLQSLDSKASQLSHYPPIQPYTKKPGTHRSPLHQPSLPLRVVTHSPLSHFLLLWPKPGHLEETAVDAL